MNLGNMIDLGKVKAARNRVYRVGVELEGGWTKIPKGVNEITRDGSVHIGMMDPPATAVGELPSPPLDLAHLEGWLTSHYPQYVNDTCGMHVHMSFPTALTYMRVMTPDYPATIIAYVTKWAAKTKLPSGNPIWARLRGESEFCQHVFFAEMQVTSGKDFDRHRKGHRYTVVNYPFARYKTIEHRLLPMMASPALAYEAIMELVSITNKFLVATSAREEKHKADIPDEPTVQMEETRLFI